VMPKTRAKRLARKDMRRWGSRQRSRRWNAAERSEASTRRLARAVSTYLAELCGGVHILFDRLEDGAVSL